MTGTELAALLTATGGLVAGGVAQWRALRADKKTDVKADTSAVLTGYDSLLDHFQAEMDRLQMTCREQIEALARHHDADRKQWEVERRRMSEEIETLKAQVMALVQAATRPPGKRTRSSD